jgi:hypothetical protein
LDELCVSIIISFLDPFEAVLVENVEKFLQEMVGRGWKEKKTFKSIQHLTMMCRYDLSDKEYSVTAWKTMHGGASSRGYLFCLGGEREVATSQNATYSFRDDPNAQLVDYETPVQNHGGFPRDWSAVAATTDAYGRIRTFGGFNGRNSVAQCYIFPTATERKNNQVSIKWKPSGQLPNPSCFTSACTTLDGHIVLTGGGSSLFQGAAVSGNVFLQRNIGADSTFNWQRVASMQSLRCGHSSAVLPSGKVVVTGGYAGGMDYLASTEYYDAAQDRWVALAPMHSARSGFGFGVSPNGAVYSFGGSSNGSDGHDTVEMFDERVGRWELLPQKMQSGRGYMGGCIGGGSGCLYAAGGVKEYATRCSVECMDPRTNTWHYLHDVGEGTDGFDDVNVEEDSYENFHFARSNFTMIYSMA